MHLVTQKKKKSHKIAYRALFWFDSFPLLHWNSTDSEKIGESSSLGNHILTLSEILTSYSLTYCLKSILECHKFPHLASNRHTCTSSFVPLVFRPWAVACLESLLPREISEYCLLGGQAWKPSQATKPVIQQNEQISFSAELLFHQDAFIVISFLTFLVESF